MYWGPSLSNPSVSAYTNRDLMIEACHDEVHQYFRDHDIPIPVAKFRALAEPDGHGEFMVTNGLVYGPRVLFHDTRVGLRLDSGWYSGKVEYIA